jgi:hypothetical protein
LFVNGGQLLAKAGDRRQEAEGRRQKAVFVTGIYNPSLEIYAFKGKVLDSICLDNS